MKKLQKIEIEQEFKDFEIFSLKKEKLDKEETLNTYSGENFIEIESFTDTAIVLFYEFTENGLLEYFHLIKDFNYFSNKEQYSTLFVELQNNEKTLLSSAKKIVLEKIYTEEIDIENERWVYLGRMTTDKIMNRLHSIYALNVSGLNLRKNIEDSKLVKRIPIREILSNSKMSEDSYIIVPFLKLYQKLFLNTMRVEDTADEIE
jgi:hypothetical protein